MILSASLSFYLYYEKTFSKRKRFLFFILIESLLWHYLITGGIFVIGFLFVFAGKMSTIQFDMKVISDLNLQDVERQSF